jgi:hypothetical protein
MNFTTVIAFLWRLSSYENYLFSLPTRMGTMRNADVPCKRKTDLPLLLHEMWKAYRDWHRGWMQNIGEDEMKSKQRQSGGSYRRMQTMKSYYAKPGKDRQKARKYGR